MKPFLFFLCGALTLLHISCSGGGDKFLGRWTGLGTKLAPKGSKVWNFDIKKRSNQSYYMVFFQFEPRDTVNLAFSKQMDCLIGNFRETTRTIKYSGDKDHLIIAPLDTTRKNFLVSEFERMNNN